MAYPVDGVAICDHCQRGLMFYRKRNLKEGAAHSTRCQHREQEWRPLDRGQHCQRDTGTAKTSPAEWWSIRSAWQPRFILTVSTCRSVVSRVNTAHKGKLKTFCVLRVLSWQYTYKNKQTKERTVSAVHTGVTVFVFAALLTCWIHKYT